MPQRAEKTMFENPDRTNRGRGTVELWEVFSTIGNETTYDPDGFLDIPNLFGTGVTTNLPQYGDPHPVPANGLCVGGRVSQVVSPSQALVLVFYRSYGLFSGGRQEGMSAHNEKRYIALPIWRQKTITTASASVLGWEPGHNTWPRTVMVRNEPRLIVGNQVSLVVKALALNTGSLWTIDGDLYQLSDKTDVSYDGVLNTWVNYRFERPCEIPAIPAGATYDHGVSIPALPALYDYVTYQPGGSPSATPIIKVVAPPNLFGGPPNYPALPGYP